MYCLSLVIQYLHSWDFRVHKNPAKIHWYMCETVHFYAEVIWSRLSLTEMSENTLEKQMGDNFFIVRDRHGGMSYIVSWLTAIRCQTSLHHCDSHKWLQDSTGSGEQSQPTENHWRAGGWLSGVSHQFKNGDTQGSWGGRIWMWSPGKELAAALSLSLSQPRGAFTFWNTANLAFPTWQQFEVLSPGGR